ncbi:MAG TPA: RNA-splicing ligase RtcB [Candidatus Aenigmarchaeota archaeon]|nr:RNA-splicing ligase RtcB [Candidatus Aenigmarchaeota archaeon]
MAAFDLEKGVISPGGIGFDINCLHPSTRIISQYGYYKKIGEFSSAFDNSNLFVCDLETKSRQNAKPLTFMRKDADRKILKIRTETGEEIVLSEDHPLFDGVVFNEARLIKEGDNVVIHPFAGVEYEQPSNEIILDEEDIIKIVGNRPKLITELKANGLMPLRYNSPKLPVLTKLVGFLTGDGWIGSYVSKKRNMNIWSTRAIGKPEDLEDVRKDIKELGYDANYMKKGQYDSLVTDTFGNKRSISGTSTQLFINSQSLSVLLHAMGVPKGNKSISKTFVPQWIKKSPLWIKRLYLAGLFGAELTKPAQRKNEPYNFIEPNFSQNKINVMEQENMNFMLEIINLLLEFKINVNKIYRQKGVINSYGKETHKLSLRISSKSENLMRLWGTIGYEYSRERVNLSAISLAYLNYKKCQIDNMRNIYELLASANENVSQINEIRQSTIRAHILRNSTEIRVPKNFQTFKDFVNTHEIKNSPFVMDKVAEISGVNYAGYVYDFMMDDKNHNFIANSIVSHNCGMRLVTTNLTINEVKPKLHELVDTFFKTVPAGVGVKGFVKPNKNQFRDVMVDGVKWCVDNGYGWKEDIERVEEHGVIKGADPSKVTDRAITRGIDQLGTLGSGNHYLEVQLVTAQNIFDAELAEKFGIFKDQIVVMVHCGSRGFGHQIATDYLRIFNDAMKKYNITVNDKELACAPFSSKEGQDYYKAMACAANMAFANRQVILHRIREGFSKVFKKTPEALEMHMVYDVAHNIAKVEEHKLGSKKEKVLVHRKGSTRSFAPGHPELADIYKKTGQPVIIGGSMETGSYLLVGTEKAMEDTFGSTAHGSGRTMSRTQAKREIRGDKLQKDMESRGIYVRAASMSGLAEEAGAAYKNITDVIDALEKSGISKPVVGLKPIGNIKG